MSSLIKNPGAWTVNKLVRRTSTNEIVSSIIKLTHPSRLQTIVVIPCPRVALDSFYQDWTYQPYLKEHQMLLSLDLLQPYYVAGGRAAILRHPEKYPGMRYFRLLRMPGPGEQDITRAKLSRRTHLSRPSALSIWFLPVGYRDKRCGRSVRKALLKMIGAKYLNHPPESERSFVVIVPPRAAEHVMAAVGELGFEVADTTDALVGNAEQIDKLCKYCKLGEALILAYLWWLLVMAAWIILSFASVEMVKFRDEYHVNRSAKITDMVGQGILTEDEGQQLLEKFSEEKSLTSSPPSTA